MDELNETKFAKLSPVEVAGFAGELERFEVLDSGVDLPEPPFDGIVGNRYPELMGGGLLDLESDQLRPLRSSMVSVAQGDVASGGVED